MPSNQRMSLTYVMRQMSLKRTYRAGSSKYVTPGIGEGPVIETRQGFSNVVPVVRGVDLIQKCGDLDIKNPFITE
jgi:hypothetical protein